MNSAYGNALQPSLAARLRPYFLNLVMGVVWGVTIPLSKLATEAGAHPLGLNLWMALGGGLLLFCICLVRRRLPKLSKEHLQFYLICGMLGSALPGTLLFYAAWHLPAGVIAITLAAVPIFTYGVSFLIRIDRPSIQRALGIAFGLLSVLLIVAPESSLPDQSKVVWVFIAIGAAVFYTGENLYIALRRPAEGDSIALLCGMLLVAALFMLPVALLTDSFVPLGSPWDILDFWILTMVASGAFAYALFLHVVTTAGPVFASQTAYIVTLAGVAWGIVLLGEQHSWWVWAALFTMVCGLALVSPRRAA